MAPSISENNPTSKAIELTRCVAGITNGQDMVAAYIRDTWPGPAANAVLAMADVGERNVEYNNSRAVEGAWFGWQVLKALVMGKRR